MSFNIKLHYIRHGETIANRDEILQGSKDYPLTDLGKTQLLNTGIELNSKNIEYDLCIISDLKRVQHSTELLISNLINKPKLLIIDSNLREVSFGVREGFSKHLSIKECKQQIAKNNGWDESRWFEIDDNIETEENILKRQQNNNNSINHILNSYINNGYEYIDAIMKLKTTHCSELNEFNLNGIDMCTVIDTINNHDYNTNLTINNNISNNKINKDIHVLIVSHGGYIIRTLRGVESESMTNTPTTTHASTTSTTTSNNPTQTNTYKSNISRILNGSISTIHHTYEHGTHIASNTHVGNTNSTTSSNSNRIQLIKRYLDMKDINVINHSSQNCQNTK